MEHLLGSLAGVDPTLLLVAGGGALGSVVTWLLPSPLARRRTPAPEPEPEPQPEPTLAVPQASPDDPPEAQRGAHVHRFPRQPNRVVGNVAEFRCIACGERSLRQATRVRGEGA